MGDIYFCNSIADALHVVPRSFLLGNHEDYAPSRAHLGLSRRQAACGGKKSLLDVDGLGRRLGDECVSHAGRTRRRNAEAARLVRRSVGSALDAANGHASFLAGSSLPHDERRQAFESEISLCRSGGLRNSRAARRTDRTDTTSRTAGWRVTLSRRAAQRKLAQPWASVGAPVNWLSEEEESLHRERVWWREAVRFPAVAASGDSNLNPAPRKAVHNGSSLHNRNRSRPEAGHTEDRICGRLPGTRSRQHPTTDRTKRVPSNWASPIRDPTNRVPKTAIPSQSLIPNPSHSPSNRQRSRSRQNRDLRNRVHGNPCRQTHDCRIRDCQTNAQRSGSRRPG